MTNFEFLLKLLTIDNSDTVKCVSDKIHTEEQFLCRDLPLKNKCRKLSHLHKYVH